MWTKQQKLYQRFLACPKRYREKIFGTKYKIKFLEEVIGVGSSTGHRWTQLGGWAEEVNRLAIGHQIHRLGDLYKVIFDKAIDGQDVKAMRLASEIGQDMLNKMKIETDEITDTKSISEDELVNRLSDIIKLSLKNESAEMVNDEEELVEDAS